MRNIHVNVFQIVNARSKHTYTFSFFPVENHNLQIYKIYLENGEWRLDSKLEVGAIGPIVAIVTIVAIEAIVAIVAIVVL